MIDENEIAQKLHKGDVIKNFRALCDLFDTKFVTRSSHSGRAILKQMDQHCKYHFNGHQIIIDDVWEDTKININADTRTSRSKFSQYIQNILLHYVYANKGVVHIPTTQLFKICGMVNAKYKSPDVTALNMMVQEWELSSFYSMTGKAFFDMIMRAIRNLQKAHLVSCTVETVIVQDHKQFVAKELDLEEIELAKRLALKQLKLNNDTEVMLHHKNKEYYNLIQKRLHNCRGWDYYYTSFKLKGVRQDLILEAIEESEQQLVLNHNIVDSMNTRVHTMVENRKEKAKENPDEKIFVYGDMFEPNQLMLIEELINLQPGYGIGLFKSANTKKNEQEMDKDFNPANWDE